MTFMYLRRRAVRMLRRIRRDGKVEAGCSILHISELETVKAAGYDYLEMMGKYLVGMDERDFYLAERTFYENDFPCKGLNAYCPESLIIAGPGFDRKRAGEYASFCAERAGAIGVKCVGIGSPRSRRLPEGYERRLADRQLTEFLKETTDAFGKKGIRVCLEPLAPCYCNYVNSMAEAAELVDRIGWENIGLVADFYNMEQTGEADGDLGGFAKLYHVHISDDDGGPLCRSYLKKERKALHQSRLSRLYQGGYTGAVSLEIDVPAQPERAKCSLVIMKAERGM